MENELYGYAIPEIKEFIGKREEEYLDRFKRLKDGRKFNFAAAFFGEFWFAYRKMWLEGLLVILYRFLMNLIIPGILGILILHGFFFDLENPSEVSEWLSYIIWFIPGGLMADRIYWKNIKKRLDFMHLPEKMRGKKLGFITMRRTCKGVSLPLGVIIPLLWAVLLLFAIKLGIDIIFYFSYSYY